MSHLSLSHLESMSELNAPKILGVYRERCLARIEKAPLLAPEIPQRVGNSIGKDKLCDM